MAVLGFVAIYIPVPGELLFRVTTGHVTLYVLNARVDAPLCSSCQCR